MKANKIWIAEVYPNSDMYADEANKTIGKPIVGKDFDKLVMNRRNVTNKLTESGNRVMHQVIDFFQGFFDPNRFKVTVKFDIHCGCSSCPCSPGFKVFVQFIDKKEFFNLYNRPNSKERINVWFDVQGSVVKNKKVIVARTWMPSELSNMRHIYTRREISYKETQANHSDNVLRPLIEYIEKGYNTIPENKRNEHKVFLFNVK